MQRTIKIISIIVATFVCLMALTLKSQAGALDELRASVAKAVKYMPGDDMEPLRQIENIVKQYGSDPKLKYDIEAALAPLLSPTSTYEARKFGCQQLAILGPKITLDILAELAATDLASGVACMAIANSPAPQAVTSLQKAYSIARASAKLQILNTLGNFRDPSTIEFFSARLKENNPQLMEASISALGKIGSKTSLSIIREFSKNNPDKYTSAITEALLSCADKAVIEKRFQDAIDIYNELIKSDRPVYIRRAAFIGLINTDKDGGEARILETLKGQDSALKPVAIAKISTLKGRKIASKFAKLIPELTPQEQVWMVDSFAIRGDKDAVSVLESLILSRDPEVRKSSAIALGRLGDSRHIPLIIKAMAETTTPGESQFFEQALCEIKGGAKADSILVDELKKSQPSLKPRLMNILARRGATTAIPALLEYSASNDPAIAKSAFKSLSRLCSEKHLDQLIERLVSLNAPQAQAEAENAIASIIESSQNRSYCEELICKKLEKTTSPAARGSLISLLPLCSGQKALSAVKTAITDADPAVRESAVRALADWRDLSAYDALLQVYEKPENEPCRVIALRGLVRILSEENSKPTDALVDKYRRLLQSAKTDTDCKMILGALSSVSHIEAMRLALSKLNNPELKAEVEMAVKKIGESIKSKYPQEVSEALQKLK